jgi:hypothetical protein
MSTDVMHLKLEAMQAELGSILGAPRETGLLELIVRRPRTEEREALQEGELDLQEGLLGDNWRTRGSSRSPDRQAHPDMQLNVMSSRVIALLAQERARWQLAGDQLYVDLDLSAENLPPGTRLAIGKAMIEVTEQPHTGCKKFAARFGLDALKFVNSPEGRQLRLRGLNAKVVQPGTIRVGDVVTKLPARRPAG